MKGLPGSVAVPQMMALDETCLLSNVSEHIIPSLTLESSEQRNVSNGDLSLPSKVCIAEELFGLEYTMTHPEQCVLSGKTLVLQINHWQIL